MKTFEELNEYLKDIEHLTYIANILRWEMDTTAPKSSYDYLIEVSTKVEIDSFKLTTSDKMIELINNVINDENYNTLDICERTYIEKLKENYYKNKNIPNEFYENYCSLKNKSLNAWVSAKENNNYEEFKPFLIDIIKQTKELYKYMYPNADNLYDCMLNDYESKMTSKQIDSLFNELKEKIKPIITNLKPQEMPIIDHNISNEELINLGKYLLNYIGFDNERGALGIYTHGYTEKMNNNDVRITFNANKNNITDTLSTIIHEGGHGIFEQNICDKLKNLYSYQSCNNIALHESQSRFYENILGRNINFWKPIYEEIKNKLKINISLEEFIKYFNNAKPSFIRTESDELTYCMHIIIRYEIERMIFNNEIDYDNLATIWNQKYEEYLGIKIEKDSDGILQDMHWSEGAFGYFPSYLIGSIFDGMLLETINKKLGNVNDILSSGKIKMITNFLNENIHIYGGTYNINEVAKRLCGEELNVNGLVKYFEEKYSNQ